MQMKGIKAGETRHKDVTSAEGLARSSSTLVNTSAAIADMVAACSSNGPHQVLLTEDACIWFHDARANVQSMGRLSSQCGRVQSSAAAH